MPHQAHSHIQCALRLIRRELLREQAAWQLVKAWILMGHGLLTKLSEVVDSFSEQEWGVPVTVLVRPAVSLGVVQQGLSSKDWQGLGRKQV